jgi:hypothetical protein
MGNRIVVGVAPSGRVTTVDGVLAETVSQADFDALIRLAFDGACDVVLVADRSEVL